MTVVDPTPDPVTEPTPDPVPDPVPDPDPQPEPSPPDTTAAPHVSPWRRAATATGPAASVYQGRDEMHGPPS